MTPRVLFLRGCGLLLSVCMAVLPLAGCNELEDTGEAASDMGATSPGEVREVPLRIAEQNGRTLAFVPVSIDGEGPFMFALDTGASGSVVDDDIAERLDLPRTGERQLVSGILGTGRVPVAEVQRWEVGDVRLEPGDILIIDLGRPRDGEGIQGLLGSDVLSDFGEVTVDYEDAALRVPAP